MSDRSPRTDEPLELVARGSLAGDTTYPHITPEFGHWFAGLIDGEGCFYIHKRHGCRFIINLRNDDLPTLQALQRNLGMGRISVSRVTPGGGRINPQGVFDISRKADCLRLTFIFDAYPLRTKKANDYAVWREAVIAQNQGHRGFTTFKERLSAVREYREPSDD